MRMENFWWHDAIIASVVVNRQKTWLHTGENPAYLEHLINTGRWTANDPKKLQLTYLQNKILMRFVSFPSTELAGKIIPSFEIKNAELLFLCIPAGYDIDICTKDSSIPNIQIYKPSHVVSFRLHKFSSHDLKTINSHLEKITEYSHSLCWYRQFDKSNIKTLSGWDIRLVNLLYFIVVKRVGFVEINTAGLAPESIRQLFMFLQRVLFQEGYTSTVVVVDPILCIDPNPYFINSDNFSRFMTFIP